MAEMDTLALSWQKQTTPLKTRMSQLHIVAQLSHQDTQVTEYFSWDLFLHSPVCLESIFQL